MQDQAWSPWCPLWPTPHSALGQRVAPAPNWRTQVGAEDKELLKPGDEHGDMKKPFLVHYPEAVLKSLLFNKKAAKLSGPEVGTGPPHSYCCCGSELGLRPRQVRGPHPDIPQGSGPSPPNRKLQETSSLHPDVDFSTDSSPNNPKAIFATCREWWVFILLFDQVAPVELRTSKITEEAHPSSLSPFRDWPPHPLLLLGRGDGYLGQNKGIQLRIRETVLSQYCWVNWFSTWFSNHLPPTTS